MSAQKYKPILCLDFDGVIHSYSGGWKGTHRADDPPVDGTVEFLHEATRHFKVAIYSSRSKSLRGRSCMKRYMRTHFAVPLTFSEGHTQDFLHEELSYPWFKPSAFLTIDDRALTFSGVWPEVGSLRNFKPWNKI